MSGTTEPTNPLVRPCLRMRHVLTFACLGAVIAGSFTPSECGGLYGAIIGAIVSVLFEV